MLDYISIASGAVSLLSPYLPHLISFGQEVGGKIKDAVVDKGLDALGEQAKKLWNKITSYFGNDPVLTGTATVVASDPQDTTRQKILIEELAKRLKGHDDLASELLEMMGGPKRLQQLIAGNEAIIRDIRFKMGDAGEQTLKAGDKATIERVEFNMD